MEKERKKQKGHLLFKSVYEVFNRLWKKLPEWIKPLCYFSSRVPCRISEYLFFIMHRRTLKPLGYKGNGGKLKPDIKIQMGALKFYNTWYESIKPKAATFYLGGDI
jgi:hypothetical protein